MIYIKADEVVGHIDKVAKEATELANKLGIGIVFNFNDIELTAVPGKSSLDIVNEYSDRLYKAVERK